MQAFFNFLQSINTILIIIIIIFLVFVFIALSQINSRLKRMARRYNRLFRSSPDEDLDFEGLLASHAKLLDDHSQDLEALAHDLDTSKKELGNNIDSLNDRVLSSIQKLGFYKYNAFEDTGSDLSFSLALLDHDNTGLILTGIYGRENSRVYAKEIRQGRPLRELSPEEEIALSRAINKN